MDDYDPIWYDRLGDDEPPGMILNILAYIFVLLVWGYVAAKHVYWFPDRVWCSASAWITGRTVDHGGRL